MTHPPEREIAHEMVASLHHSSGSFELVAGALIAALTGFGLDRLIGSTPLFTIVFAVAGLIGATYSILFTYRAKMAAAGQARSIARDRGATQARSIARNGGSTQ